MMLIGQKISILGAGIGGLTTAIALAHRGAQVTVYEQAAAVKEVGAGLQISPNGFKVLRALGLDGALQACSVRGRQVELFDAHAGAPVFSLDLDVNGSEFPYYFVHRADFITILRDAAVLAGVDIQLGARATSVALGGVQSQVTFATGEGVSCDLLIGADGLHSVVRDALNGADRPLFTGQVAWRAIAPRPANLPEQTSVRVFMGAGRHLVCYPLRDGQWMNIVAVQERDMWAEESWNVADDPDNLRAAFADFRPEVQELLQGVTHVHLWGLFRHPVAPKWHKNHAVILGDAAHPSLPFLAQGAVMALEDAWVLTQALADADCPAEAFAAYQSARFTRVSRVIEAASKNAKNYHLRPGPLRSLAHGALKLGSTLAPRMAARQFDWIYTHDVTKDS